MHLTRLSLSNFRIFSRLELDFPRRVILFYGSNAQGKTSILEAVAFQALFASFTAAADRQLINFNLPEDDDIRVGRIVAGFERGGKQHTLETRLILERNGRDETARFRKQALLDGLPKRFGELFGQFNAVSFLPQMSKIIEGSPSDRRRFMDEVLCQTEPGYSRHMIKYNQALTRRNALLKLLAEHRGSLDQLDPWDQLLAEEGAHLICGRLKLVKEIELLAQARHQELSQGKEVLRLDYQPSFDPSAADGGQLGLPVDLNERYPQFGIEEAREAFSRGLARKHQTDLQRGITSVGPHRDELRFLANQVDLGNYGSRGQARTALLSLKFAEVDLMKARTGEWPVLLLDEVMAELDPARRQALMNLLDQAEQAFVTTTDLEMFEPAFLARHEVWNVHQGVVQKR